MKTRTVSQVDEELKKLRSQALDTLRTSARWEVIWEKIDLLLDERSRLVVDSSQN